MDEKLIKNARTRGAAALAIANLSLLFMLISPVIENPLGRRMDQRLLADLEGRIEEARKTDVTALFQLPGGAPLKGARIGYRLLRHEFLFGCNIFEFDRMEDPVQNELYKRRFRELFNTAVLPFYWSRYEPGPGRFPDRDRLAAILDWCNANGITPKGHPLCWRNPAGYPGWLPEDEAEVRGLLQKRVAETAGAYRERIPIWDVVNEPTHLPPFGFDSQFEYVSAALRWARRAAGPETALTVNDYGILGHDFGRGPFYRLCRKLVQAGEPLDVIGLQGHEPRTDWIPAVEINATLDAYARLGLPIHITEITVPGSPQLPITNSWKKGVWSEKLQAEYLERFYRVCFAHPAVGGIIHWDLWDGASWVRGGGLLDEKLRPKAAYKTLDRLINREWRTRGEAAAGPDGSISFRGFRGTYLLTVKETGETFTLKAQGEGPHKFVFTASAPPGAP